MRLRRIITLSTVGLVVAAITVVALPGVLSNQGIKLPESIQELTEQFETKPVTIFDPPKYSLDDASSLWLVVNKQRQITPQRYRPASLAFPAFEKPTIQNPFRLKLRGEAAVAAAELATAMSEAGKGTLILNSGFRSYKTQSALYERTKAERGLKVAEKLSARPGFSEHQTGLAADFSAADQGCVIMTCFGRTEAGIWLEQNAHKYGFILRYPKGYKPMTGFQYEPWHFRFVGIELATELKTNGIKTLEEFWGLAPAPEYATPAG